MSRRKILILIASVVVILAIIAGTLAYNFWKNMPLYGQNSPGPGINRINELKEYDADEEGIKVTIPKGASTDKIASILTELGIIEKPMIFKLISKVMDFDGKYKPGTYQVLWEMGYMDIMTALTGKPITIKVTIPEHFNILQTAERLEEAGLVNAKKFLNFMQKATSKFDLDIPKDRNPKYEGYLYPATYTFEYGASMEEILNTFLYNFNYRFKEKLQKESKKLGLTPDQIVILASIVQREGKVIDEFDDIAGVFINRINQSKKLESCATIQYIFATDDDPKTTVKDIISIEDTKIENPYNTYLHTGLPPGPICSPGEDAINAVLNYKKHDYLFFVAKGDGTHHFSRTYEEHKIAASKYLN